ncbi:BZ3500_MvSof-1268-A1-R1_Chr7-1g09089 [Microbotryum saponariae]|uniref:BZ3500_MvSof-1268-A1-R1_Chr7-1g09089 protein n=1 Tax=Microbotryum saponariae TaxID=289078 RepID=A0A2X0KW63_9BASI|nr:BZ3501_MvSof-1269-A2-R1_Chr7-1g08794 [Microbotryum saponariae]SDA02780.1 BZ3500_MvSof-1268-A1-R1_Chr7-1g09089 [Microbotryum saponariae]
MVKNGPDWDGSSSSSPLLPCLCHSNSASYAPRPVALPKSTPLPSFELSSPTTPSASLRIKNKVKGFSEGLLQRRSRGEQSDGASTPRTGSRKMPGDLPLLEDLRSQSLDLGERRSWDILRGMTLGRFGTDKKEEMLLAASPAVAEGPRRRMSIDSSQSSMRWRHVIFKVELGIDVSFIFYYFQGHDIQVHILHLHLHLQLD